MHDWIGAILSILVVFLYIAVVTLIEKKLHLSQEATRKLIHIGVGHWIFLAFMWIDNKLIACVPLVLFIVLNYLSLKTKLFAAMETDERKSYGTVYYPIALLLLTLIFYDIDRVSLAVGVMALAWGDGMAAVIGRKYGKIRYRVFSNTRSIEGSFAMLIFSFLVITILLTTLGNYDLFVAAREAVILAFAAAILELITDRDFDNLTIPLGVAALCYYIL